MCIHCDAGSTEGAPVAFSGARREPHCVRPVYLQWRWDQLIYSYQCAKAHPDLRSKLSSEVPQVLSRLLKENSFPSPAPRAQGGATTCVFLLPMYLGLLCRVGYF